MGLKTGVHRIAQAIRTVTIVSVVWWAFYNWRDDGYALSYFTEDGWTRTLLFLGCLGLGLGLAWIIDGFARGWTSDG